MATNLSSNISGTPCPFVFPEVIVIASFILYFFFTPLFLYVLYEGYRRTKTQQCPPSHSDVFTFHIIGMEILSTSGTFIIMFATKNKKDVVLLIGNDLYNIGVVGQMWIHCLTCVERYLAVVHPITYLRLKKRGGVIIRNMSIIGVWFYSIGVTILYHFLTLDSNVQLYICYLILPVTLVMFCSASVLFVLIRPKPGDGDVGRIDQSKRKAFITITVILGVLLLRFVYSLVPLFMTLWPMLSLYNICLVAYLTPFFYFPSSLVLPLIFLQKARKLPKCFAMN